MDIVLSKIGVKCAVFKNCDVQKMYLILYTHKQILMFIFYTKNGMKCQKGVGKRHTKNESLNFI